jgi:hypothetical protein
MGYSGRVRSRATSTKGVLKKQPAVKEKEKPPASPSNRDNWKKQRDEAHEEAARISESVNGFARGLGSFLTGQKPAEATNETERGEKEKPAEDTNENEAGKGNTDGPCANRDCAIGGGIANSTHKCPGCKKNIHAVCGEETENNHHMLCPHCKEKEDDTDSDKDSDEEERVTKKRVTRQGRSGGGETLRKIMQGKQVRGKQLAKAKARKVSATSTKKHKR